MGERQEQKLFAGALEYLELLAAEAHPARFDEPVASARRAGAAPETLAALEQVRRLAWDIQGNFQRRQERDTRHAALLDAAREFIRPHEFNELLRLTCRRARTLFSLDMAYISLYNPATGTGTVQAVDGHCSALTPGFIVPGKGGLGNAASSTGAPYWTPDYLNDSTITHSPAIDETVQAEGLRAIIVVPLSSNGTYLGSLYAGHRAVRHFTPEEVAQMGALGEMAAAALDTMKSMEGVRTEARSIAQDAHAVERQLRVAQRLARAQSALLDEVADGAGPQQLLTVIAELLDGSVLLEDADGKTRSTAGLPPQTPPEPATLRASALEAHADRRVVACGTDHWVAPVFSDRAQLGQLVLHRNEPLDEDTSRLLYACARVTALVMRRRGGPEDPAVHEELLEALLTPGPGSVGRLRNRARTAGLDLGEPYVVLAARPADGMTDRVRAWARAYARDRQGLHVCRDDHVVLLLAGEDAMAAGQATIEQATAARCPMTVGVDGPVTGPEPVTRAYRRALRSLGALATLGATSCVASARDLGSLTMLLTEERDVDGFVRHTIGPVLDFDTQRSADLAVTLDAYFLSGGSPTRAAEQLFIHPNTVSRRLERVTELLGAGWQEQARSLEIQLALRIHRIRQSLGPKDAPGHLDTPTAVALLAAADLPDAANATDDPDPAWQRADQAVSKRP
ncbi:helix-turn-helix domain-containing protein [Streptomyces sp. NPDC002088]|uniref:helix-turn-helix domain-containing protein n=1 Tax=Streptomyces sp. NPDC002088 TaxID=3154665 RepID=UPI003320704A